MLYVVNIVAEAVFRSVFSGKCQKLSSKHFIPWPEKVIVEHAMRTRRNEEFHVTKATILVISPAGEEEELVSRLLEVEPCCFKQFGRTELW